jgi:hypothetical protein
MLRWTCLAVGVAWGLGCSSTFNRVDFRYSSRTYRKPEDAMISVDIPPKDLVMRLSEGFRANGAMIIARSRMDRSVFTTPECLACWKADRELALEEMSYRSKRGSKEKSG